MARVHLPSGHLVATEHVTGIEARHNGNHAWSDISICVRLVGDSVILADILEHKNSDHIGSCWVSKFDQCHFGFGSVSSESHQDEALRVGCDRIGQLLQVAEKGEAAPIKKEEAPSQEHPLNQLREALTVLTKTISEMHTAPPKTPYLQEEEMDHYLNPCPFTLARYTKPPHFQVK